MHLVITAEVCQKMEWNNVDENSRKPRDLYYNFGFDGTDADPAND